MNDSIELAQEMQLVLQEEHVDPLRYPGHLVAKTSKENCFLCNKDKATKTNDNNR